MGVGDPKHTRELLSRVLLGGEQKANLTHPIGVELRTPNKGWLQGAIGNRGLRATYMLPGSMVHDVGYDSTGNIKLTCQFSKIELSRGVKPSDLQSIILREDGFSIATSRVIGSDTENFHRVDAIPGLRKVFQIIKSWIEFVAILVIHLVAFGFWAKKRFGNKDMDKVLFASFVRAVVEHDAQIDGRSASQARLKNLAGERTRASLDTPHASQVANLIDAFIANYIAPFFVHSGFSYRNKVAPTRMSRKCDQTSARKGNGKTFYKAFETMTNSFGRSFIIPQEAN